MARAPFAYWRPIPSATDPKIVPIGAFGAAEQPPDWQLVVCA